jgi:acetyl esterase
MPVLPALNTLFDGIAAGASRPAPQPPPPAAQARAAIHAVLERNVVAFYAPHAPLAREADYSVAVPDGVIRVRLYASTSPDVARPCHLYLHGGGFWVGALDHFDVLCRALAEDAECVVVSVDYRLAPEHKFPTAAEDCYAALLWVAAHAPELGVDPARISVGGVSAGGNLAAVVALMARDRGGPRLALQVLEIPITDLTDLAPLRVPAEDLVLPSGKDEYAGHYLADPAEAATPYASPLLAPDLSGLPPALVMTAEYDAFAAEGAAYARRLAEAGVPVEHRCWEGQFHGSQQLAALIPAEAAAYQAQLVSALRRAWSNDSAQSSARSKE